MKRFSLVLATFGAALSLNAAVVATVDGKNITDTEVNEALTQVSGGQITNVNSLSATEKSAFIRQYVADKLLADDARKQNFEKSADYTKALENAKNQISVQMYLKKYFDAVKVDNKVIREAYDKNKSQFVQPARVRAKHILVASESDAKSIINEVKNLKGDALNSKFSEIARSKSIDTGTAQNGGELPWFGENDMVKPFADAAFSLKKGEVSKTPIKTDFGYHIIYKIDSQAKKQLSFDEVKTGLENQYKMGEAQRAIARRAQELLDKAKIEIK